MRLSSGIQREMQTGFVLDEDGLRRILGVLEARASTLPHKWAIVITVRREDDRFYETVNIQDVLSDANTVDHEIRNITIELRSDDPAIPIHAWDRGWIVQVVFSIGKKENIQINVNSADRTWALLVADELEPQVRRTRSQQRISGFLLYPFFFALSAFASSIARAYGAHFGISSTWIERVVFFSWAISILIFLASLENRPAWLTNFAGPQSAFAWGDRAKSFAQCIERQKNFFWVVIVGLLISVASSIYTSIAIPSAFPIPNLPGVSKPIEEAASSPR